MNRWNGLRQAFLPAAQRLESAMREPRGAQEDFLRQVLHKAAATEAGRRHGFSGLRNADDYRRRVPLSSYADIADDVKRMARGARDVLVSDELRAFERTSGTSGPEKLIPVTAMALSGIQAALYPWLHDLLQSRPAITAGRSWWILSAPTRTTQFTPGGIPVGMPDDAAWFGAAAARYLPDVLVPLPDSCGDDDWRFRSLAALLACEDLALVSVWSPVTLTALLELLAADATRPLAILERMGVGLRRRRAVAHAISRNSIDTAALWPMLDTISCWTDAASAPFAQDLQQRFPHVHLQGKGLMSTEGVVSLPLAAYPAPVPALNSTFIEFLTDSGESLLCNELTEHQRYTLAITTAGGLYRHATGDTVEVVAMHSGIPALRFAGRRDVVSDLCGEKLSEDFVLSALPERRGFMVLAPVIVPARRYCLLLDEQECDDVEAGVLAARVEQALQRNPHYALARNMGQLDAVQSRRIPAADARYRAAREAEGALAGVIKPPALFASTRWTGYFTEQTA